MISSLFFILLDPKKNKTKEIDTLEFFYNNFGNCQRDKLYEKVQKINSLKVLYILKVIAAVHGGFFLNNFVIDDD